MLLVQRGRDTGPLGGGQSEEGTLEGLWAGEFVLKEQRRTTLRLWKALKVLGERPGLGDPVLEGGSGSGDGERRKSGGGRPAPRAVKNGPHASACSSVLRAQPAALYKFNRAKSPGGNARSNC